MTNSHNYITVLMLVQTTTVCSSQLKPNLKMFLDISLLSISKMFRMTKSIDWTVYVSASKSSSLNECQIIFDYFFNICMQYTYLRNYANEWADICMHNIHKNAIIIRTSDHFCLTILDMEHYRLTRKLSHPQNEEKNRDTIGCYDHYDSWI